MKVYIVQTGWCEDGDEEIAVFSDESVAKGYANYMSQTDRIYSQEEIEVDDPETVALSAVTTRMWYCQLYVHHCQRRNPSAEEWHISVDDEVRRERSPERHTEGKKYYQDGRQEPCVIWYDCFVWADSFEEARNKAGHQIRPLIAAANSASPSLPESDPVSQSDPSPT